MSFNNTIECSEISSHFDKKILQFTANLFGPVNDISMKESNGQSVVIVSNERSVVFQHYINTNTFNCIVKMIKHLKKSRKIIYCVGDTDICIKYDVFDYLTPFNNHINHFNIIEWKKIYPIDPICKSSQFTNDFISKNLFKIMWDIGKALYAMHLNNYLHKDPSIDNVGINDAGNFVLFDFDMSTSFFISYSVSHDYHVFNRSLNFYIDDKYLQATIKEITDQHDNMLTKIIEIVSEINGIKQPFEPLLDKHIHETINFLQSETIKT